MSDAFMIFMGFLATAVFSVPLWGPFLVEHYWPEFFDNYGHLKIVLMLSIPWLFVGIVMMIVFN